MNKIAIVIQRSHASIVGGAEALAWTYATLLKEKYQVEIITTTAVDAVLWTNELPEGIETRDGVLIRRFHVDHGRTLYWHALHERLLKLFDSGVKKIHWTLALQEEFIIRQGPYSQKLLNFLSEEHLNYKKIIFFTYLFPTTYLGIRCCLERQIFLVPTLHDEAPAYFSAYALMAARTRCLLWNTQAEKKLGLKLWGERTGEVIGTVMDTREYAPARLGYPYILYCGRIDTHKGCPRLVEYFERYKQDHPSALRLIMTGEDTIGLSSTEEIELKGFVSENDKFSLMSGAEVFVMPSPNESLSIVTLEAMVQRTPVLVNGSCEVLVDHVTESRGGMIYSNYEAFSTALNHLCGGGGTIKEMGDLARAYVIERYSRTQIKKRLVDLIEDDD